jgi:hypothetical protein
MVERDLACPGPGDRTMRHLAPSTPNFL